MSFFSFLIILSVFGRIMNSIRVLLSLVTNLEWPLLHLNVKNAFLHGDLEEEVYINCCLVPSYIKKWERLSVEKGPLWFKTITQSLV